MATDTLELLKALVAIDSVNPSLVAGGAGEREIAASWSSGHAGPASTAIVSTGVDAIAKTGPILTALAELEALLQACRAEDPKLQASQRTLLVREPFEIAVDTSSWGSSATRRRPCSERRRGVGERIRHRLGGRGLDRRRRARVPLTF